MITWENYEEYMMMHADGELQAAETQALIDFVSKHPELKNEMALYESTKLSPDTTLVYANKESLIKPLPVKRVIALPVWGKYAAAACIAGLLFVSFFKYSRQHNEEQAIVKVKTIAPAIEQHAPKTAVPQNTTVAQQAPATKMKDDRKQDNAQPVPFNHKTPAIALVKTIKKPNEGKEVKEEISTPINTPIEVLPTASVKEIPHTRTTVTKPAVVAMPVFAVAEDNDDPENRSFLDRLPIDDIKKKQLGNIASTVSDVYKDITQPNKEGDKRFSIKIEKKKLVLSF